MEIREQRDGRLARGGQTRARLLDEGLRLFALKGYDAVTTREIAAAAGVNQAAIHFHFQGKDGLYEAVIDHVARLLLDLHAASAESSGPDAPGAREHLAARAASLLRTPRSRWMTLLLQRECIMPTPGFERLYDKALRPILEGLSEVAEDAAGCPRGGFENTALSFCLFILLSAFARNRSTFLRWAGKDDYSSSDIQAVSGLVADFLLAGLRRDRGAAPRD
ncbi:CerR family C-terminal domain-containing protein [Desulfovibrio aminophilus]|nr:CerR family C-terminal domain-containing protein [Desulfovibrio aminophilus]MCM0754984.1 CerR family C-terminal domain-containing protein [Desulfovibrio aminophilus]